MIDYRDEEELPDTGSGIIDEVSGKPEIAFEKVSFAYDKKEVLHDVSFDRRLFYFDSTAAAK